MTRVREQTLKRKEMVADMKADNLFGLRFVLA
jgi:hypothetical protein